MERNEALKRMMAECARGEMCTGQVREKLLRMIGAEDSENNSRKAPRKTPREAPCEAPCQTSVKTSGKAAGRVSGAGGRSAQIADEIISELVAGGFVDDRRFAGSFVRDRYRFYGWGPRKVEMKLTEWGVDKEIIDSAILGERELAASTLARILESKSGTIDRQADARIDALRKELRRATDSGDDGGDDGGGDGGTYENKRAGGISKAAVIAKIKSRIYAAEQSRKAKLVAFALQRGFDYSEIFSAIDSLQVTSSRR